MPNTIRPVVPVSAYSQLYAKRVAALLPKSGAVLEVGADEGDFAHAVSASDRSVVALDLDRRALAQCQSPSPVCADACRLPFPADAFDLVAMFDVIEHVASPFDVLVEVRRVLSSSGSAVITTPNLVGLDRWLRPDRWSGVADPSHRYLFSPTAFKHLLLSAGFTTLTVRTPFHGLGRIPPIAARLMEQSMLGGQLWVEAT